MYSQDAISSRGYQRRQPTDEMMSGLACVVCGIGYRTVLDADERVVFHRGGTQLLACHGVCARRASGSATGLDETPVPLAERMSGQQADDRS